MNLAGKTALITGASSGFGKVTAELLSQKGCRLILIARRKERLSELEQSLKTDTYIHEVDVTDQEQVEKFFNDLPKDFENIDCLINNAGLGIGRELAPEANLDDWQQMVDTNIKGLLNVTNPVVKLMKERGTGHIINIGSCAAYMPYQGGNVYGATKAFVRQFSRNLRVDLFGSDVRVSNIEPGASRTEFADVRNRGDMEKVEEYYQGMRYLLPSDVAETIVWIMERPLRVNIDNVEIMPIDQYFAGVAINRSSK